MSVIATSRTRKRCEINTKMHSVFVRKQFILIKKFVSWKLSKFDKVKYNVAYGIHCEEMDFDLELRKKRKSLQIDLYTKAYTSNICCNLIYGNKPEMTVCADLIGKGKYRMTFLNFGRVVFKDAPLLLDLYYDFIILDSETVDIWDSARAIHNRNTPGKELFKMYERQLFTDFVISVPGKEFRVHKAILASRLADFSRCMCELDENKEGKILSSATPEVMEKVIRFLYTSEIHTTNLADVISVFYLATELNILCLRKLCTFKLSHILVKQNAPRILEVAKDLGDYALAKLADRLLEGRAS